MLPYIDVEGLRELPLTLLGRFPDKIPKKFVDKIAQTEALFKVSQTSGSFVKRESPRRDITGWAEENSDTFFFSCSFGLIDCAQGSSAQDLGRALGQVQRRHHPYCQELHHGPRYRSPLE